MKLTQTKERTARKFHRCHICGCGIAPKSRYVLLKIAEFFGPWEKRQVKNQEQKLCLDCGKENGWI